MNIPATNPEDYITFQVMVPKIVGNFVKNDLSTALEETSYYFRKFLTFNKLKKGKRSKD